MNKNIVVFGEVLFDCFPDGQKIIGGAPFNVAWHLQAFDVQPLLISRVGNDSTGNQILRSMRQWGMMTDGVQRDPGHPTGQVTVNFVDGEPEYDIVANSAWDFIAADRVPDISENFILYHGSLGLRNQTSLNAFLHLKQKGHAEYFVDINLRPPWAEPKLINSLLFDAKFLKMNEKELADLSGGDDNQFVEKMFEKHSMELILITQGAKGAQIVGRNGFYDQRQPQPGIKVLDTVGAGDAFSSVFLLGLLLDWPLELIIQRAIDFAGAIVAIRGAVSFDSYFYQNFKDQWKLA